MALRTGEHVRTGRDTQRCPATLSTCIALCIDAVLPQAPGVATGHLTDPARVDKVCEGCSARLPCAMHLSSHCNHTIHPSATVPRSRLVFPCLSPLRSRLPANPSTLWSSSTTFTSACAPPQKSPSHHLPWAVRWCAERAVTLQTTAAHLFHSSYHRPPYSQSHPLHSGYFLYVCWLFAILSNWATPLDVETCNLSNHVHTNPQNAGNGGTAADGVPSYGGGNSSGTSTNFELSLEDLPSPKQLVEALDEYVVGQQHAKKVGPSFCT